MLGDGPTPEGASEGCPKDPPGFPRVVLGGILLAPRDVQGIFEHFVVFILYVFGCVIAFTVGRIVLDLCS